MSPSFRLSTAHLFLGILTIIPITSLSEAQGIFGTNLIVNAGAEAGPGGDGTNLVASVPGWTRTGSCDVCAYATAYQNIRGVSANDIIPRGAQTLYIAVHN